MEAPIARNTIEITEELFREAVREPFRDKYRALMAKVSLVLGGLLLLLCVVTRMMGGSPVTLMGEAALLVAVMLWLRFSLPRAERRRVWRGMSRNNPPFREVSIYEDHFTVRGNDEIEEIFTWDEVASVRTTEHLLILKLTAGREVMLDRFGFSTGSEADVLDRVQGTTER